MEKVVTKKPTVNILNNEGRDMTDTKVITKTQTSEVAPRAYRELGMGQIVERLNMDEIGVSREFGEIIEGGLGEATFDQETKYERNYHPDGTVSNEFFAHKKTFTFVKEG